MRRLAALVAVLAAGFLLFYAGSSTLPPLSADAPPQAFSAGRAVADIAVMAKVPHPVGSPQNAAVRDYLIARMRALGLSPQVQSARSQRFEIHQGEVYGFGGDIQNVIGVLPGRDRAAPALALMAHYDSVAGSPGAADDLAGVTSALEIARAIKAQGAPVRDVMLVFTDGEEAGLLGAQAFFDANPLARRVGFILNMEARGGGGRAAMFETGASNGAAVRLYAKVAPRPSANSLSVFLYKQLPNDTDFTVAKEHGAAGLNFAFIGRQFDYHSPSSTLAALDQGAVQHMGDQALATARALAFAPNLPPRAPDAVYGTLPGGLLLAYPTTVGWVLLAGVAGLILLAAWRARMVQPLSWLDALQGAGAGLLVMVAAALALHLTRGATGFGFGWFEARGLLARFPAFEAAMAFSGAGAAMLAAAALSQGRLRAVAAGLSLAAGLAASAFGGLDVAGLIEGGICAGLCLLLLGRRAKLAGAWLGVLLAALIVAVALQWVAPTTGLIVAWPLAAASVCAAVLALGHSRARAAWSVTALIGVVAVAWTGDLFHNLLQGLDTPELPLVTVWLAALTLWPLLWPQPGEPFPKWAPGAGSIAIGVALALALHFTSPWSPRHPRAAEPYYVLDHDTGRAWRASPIQPDPWSAGVLTADGGRIGRQSFPGFRRLVWAAQAIPRPSTSPISVSRASDGRITLNAALSSGQRMLLDLASTGPVTDVLVNGRPAPILTRAGQVTHLRWEAAPEGVTVSFKPLGAGALDARYAVFAPGWPVGANPPPMPAEMMAWDLGASTVTVGDLKQRW